MNVIRGVNPFAQSNRAVRFGGHGKKAFTGPEMVDFLVGNGFTIREGGSGHTVLTNGGKRTVVPHQKRALSPGTQNVILNQSGTKDTFLAQYGPKKKTNIDQ
jgi:predicted RNA binding protein YcfA (HicA-like mRNA interferase family)